VLVQPPRDHGDGRQSALDGPRREHAGTEGFETSTRQRRGHAIKDPPTATTAFAALRNYAVGAPELRARGRPGQDRLRPACLGAEARLVDPPQFRLGFPPGNLAVAEWGTTDRGRQRRERANPPGLDLLGTRRRLRREVNPANGYTRPRTAIGLATRTTTNSRRDTLALVCIPYLSFDWTPTPCDRPHSSRCSRRSRHRRPEGLARRDAADQETTGRGWRRSFEDRHFSPDALGAGGEPGGYTAARAVITGWTSVGYDCPTGSQRHLSESPQVTDTPHAPAVRRLACSSTPSSSALEQRFNDDLRLSPPLRAVGQRRCRRADPRNDS